MSGSPTLARAHNLWRRLAAGLPLRGTVVDPALPTSVYQAQRSLYLFAAGHLAGRDVVDLDSSGAWGPALLVERGARSCLGILADPSRLARARRQRGPAHVQLTSASEPWWQDRGRSYAGATAFALARHPRPADALRRLTDVLAPAAVLVVAVPPVVDDLTRDRHRGDPSLPGSRYAWEWEQLLRTVGAAEIRAFRHEPPPGAALALADPRPSPYPAESFTFVELPLADLGQVGSLSAVFVARLAG
jgi:hypothetical protein